jgi:hypothetical protein
MADIVSKGRAGIAASDSGIGIATPVGVITSPAAGILPVHTMDMANTAFPIMSGIGKDAIGCGIRRTLPAPLSKRLKAAVPGPSMVADTGGGRVNSVHEPSAYRHTLKTR